jgi:hypothetical protein
MLQLQIEKRISEILPTVKELAKSGGTAIDKQDADLQEELVSYWKLHTLDTYKIIGGIKDASKESGKGMFHCFSTDGWQPPNRHLGTNCRQERFESCETQSYVDCRAYGEWFEG